MSHRFLRVFVGLTFAVLLVGAGAVPAVAAAGGGAAANQSLDDPPVDSDGDGVPDDIDACPNEYGDSGYGGCPYVPLPTDSDGDGVYDDTDQCPSDPGPPAYNGCPVPDSDGDGLTDDVDACPDLPGPYDGCPLTDLDGDGVYDDGGDLCPNEPGLPEHNGCPAPDSDGDGMNDDVDQCDDTPPGTPIDGLGCSLSVVTATPPIFTDRCGKGQDTVTVPTSDGVVYRLGANVVAAGTYRVKGTVRVVAEAADGYVLTGGAEWNMVMTKKVCPRGRLKVKSTGPGQVRVVNREAVAMTIQLGSKAKRVEPGARIIWMPSGTVEWSVRWKSALISVRSGSVHVL